MLDILDVANVGPADVRMAAGYSPNECDYVVSLSVPAILEQR